jgi:drug/metabolite transporter (DMT)-like permease
MKLSNEQKAYLHLHIAVLLFGLTAILGDLIKMAALPIVWWRLLITSISLIFIVNVIRLFKQMSWQRLLLFSGIGVIVGLHWLAFYGSIKLSNASIALVCMATASFFTAIIEPIVLKQKFKWYEGILGIIIIPGMVLIVTDLSPELFWGIPVGLVSAFLAALFSTLNKKYINEGKVLRITFLELSAAFVFLSILLPLFKTGEGWSYINPSRMDWVYLVILALLCTTLAFVLALSALREVSAFASSLTINLEPVYGIALAWILLDDNKELAPTFYYGVLVILLAVFSYPYLNKYFKRRNANRK